MLRRELQNILYASFRQDGKMLFVSGPRQCGKTTLARMMLAEAASGRYWSYDIPEDQRLLVKQPDFFLAIDRDRGVKPLIVLDEIHKYPRWRNYLKGAFDRSGREFDILVTGSGRLDVYRKGGDSLAGRYFQHRLFPLTIGELAGGAVPLADFISNPADLPTAGKNTWPMWQTLEKLGGFPEPFTRGTASFYRKWAAPYRRQLVREDIRDLGGIRDLAHLELLSTLIPERVGSIFSVNALREDVGVSFDTLKNWIGVFETFFLVFLIRPWHKTIARAVRKEPKLYLYDWAAVPDPGARFENMVALHFLHAIARWTEAGEGEFGLHFVRDREKNEVDFLLVRDGAPLVLVEAKSSDMEPSFALRKMQRALGVPAVILVNRPGISRTARPDGMPILIASADRWLRALPTAGKIRAAPANR